VVQSIIEHRPTIVHFACHGLEQALLFRDHQLGSSEFATLLKRRMSELHPPSQRVRLVVVNACQSGAFARELLQCADFAIGHGEEDAVDEQAIDFTQIFYRSMGEGQSLLGSFLAAGPSSESRSYQLFCRLDPARFALATPQRTAATLAATVEELTMRVADAMSGADTDDARSQASTESEPGDIAPVEGGWTVLGIRHDGNVAEFQSHMKQLVVDFVFGERQRGTFWQLLMAAFMRHSDFGWGGDSEQPWLFFGKSADGQMKSLESFEQTLQSDAMHHPWLEEWGFKKARRGFRKPKKHHCAVWVLDQVNPNP
jgi:hypothetical protein